MTAAVAADAIVLRPLPDAVAGADGPVVGRPVPLDGRASSKNCPTALRRAVGRGTRDEATSAVCQAQVRGVPAAGIPGLAHPSFVVTAARPTGPSRATYHEQGERPCADGRGSWHGRRPPIPRALAVVEQTVWTLKVAALAALVGVTFAAVLVDLVTPEPAHERVVEGFTPQPHPSSESTERTGSQSRKERLPVRSERNGA